MRLGRLIRGDIHFQWKYGFYFIYFILTLLYVCAIAALPECKLRSNGMPVPLLRNCYSIFNGTKYR